MNRLYSVIEGEANDQAISTTYLPNTNFKSCECDRVQGGCDAFCCCDTDCSE